MDQQQASAPELSTLTLMPADQQTHAIQQQIIRFALASVGDDVVFEMTKALKNAIPPRVYNPFVTIDPAKAIHETMYSGKYLLVHLLEQECKRRTSTPLNPEHIA